jgi:hypothetical protein
MMVPMTDRAASTISRGMVNLREERKLMMEEKKFPLFSLCLGLFLFCFTRLSLYLNYGSKSATLLVNISFTEEEFNPAIDKTCPASTCPGCDVRITHTLGDKNAACDSNGAMRVSCGKIDRSLFPVKEEGSLVSCFWVVFASNSRIRGKFYEKFRKRSLTFWGNYNKQIRNVKFSISMSEDRVLHDSIYLYIPKGG